jgi:hypothetical protein
MPFPYVALAHLGAKPLEPFGKGSNALKAGTPDAGPEGPTLSGALNTHWRFKRDLVVRSAPGRGRAEWGLIRAAGEERQGYRGKGYSGSAGGLGGPLDQLGEPHRQFDAFADLLVAGPGGSGGFTKLLYAGE